MPGMFCHVSLALERRPNAMTVPGSAVYPGNGQPFVLIADGGKAKKREVELGLDDGIVVEIRSGLNGNERVILGRPAGLGDGDSVSAGGRP